MTDPNRFLADSLPHLRSMLAEHTIARFVKMFRERLAGREQATQRELNLIWDECFIELIDSMVEAGFYSLHK